MENNSDNKNKGLSVQEMIGIGSDFEKSMHGGHSQGTPDGNNHNMNTGMNATMAGQGVSAYGNGNMNPGNAPYGNPNINPGMNRNINSNMNPGMNPNMNQGMNPNMNPWMNQGMNPNMNPGMNPGMNPNMNPGLNQGMNPNMNPRMNPGMNPNMNPGMNQGMNPNMNPGMNPGMNPNMNLGMNQGMNPNMNPNMHRNDSTDGDVSSRLARELSRSMNDGDEYEDDYKRRIPVRTGRGNNKPQHNNNRRNIRPEGKRVQGSNIDFTAIFSNNAMMPVVIFGVIIALCLLIALIVFSKTSKNTDSQGGVIPTDIPTITGVIPEVYAKLVGTSQASNGQSGNLGAANSNDTLASGGYMGNDTLSTDAMGGLNDSASMGAGVTSGATMVVDAGEGVSGYSAAASYTELLSQLEGAIASADVNFVGSKLCYEDDNGNICGYPQSVVDYFVSYMSANSEKRSNFIQEIQSDKYSYTNGDAYVVKLPKIKFVVNMGYDNTTVSISGFADQVVDSGQKAEIQPLLPCMYTITISNPDWTSETTKDIEANVDETVLSINIKP